MENNTEVWDEIIKPKTKIFDLHLADIIKYKDLLFIFVKRDITTIYKQTILGVFWFFIPPILTTLVFNIIFSNIAKLSTDGAPSILFYMSGVVVWNYFSECFTRTSSTFTANAHIFGKVYFPRLIVPLSSVISSLYKFGVQFILFIIIFAYFLLYKHSIHPNIFILLVPVLLVLMAGISLGFGIIISSLTTKYRDFTFLIGFGVTLLMYATPIIYPLSAIPSPFNRFININPLTSIVETFRFAFIGCGSFNLNNFIYTVIFTFCTLIIGVVLFNRVERNFMDTV